mmetsp:Transcript_44808/g.112664  ORF Transcript_44808/g.112664 Transcript_44808/m.112664 type:complete len:304 (+) Transcript_44808:1549-2460(+)
MRLQELPSAEAVVFLCHLDRIILSPLPLLLLFHIFFLLLCLHVVKLVDPLHVHLPLRPLILHLNPLQNAPPELAHGGLEFRDLDCATAVLIDAIDHGPALLDRQVDPGLGKHSLHLPSIHGLIALLEEGRVVLRMAENVDDSELLFIQHVLDGFHDRPNRTRLFTHRLHRLALEILHRLLRLFRAHLFPDLPDLLTTPVRAKRSFQLRHVELTIPRVVQQHNKLLAAFRSNLQASLGENGRHLSWVEQLIVRLEVRRIELRVSEEVGNTHLLFPQKMVNGHEQISRVKRLSLIGQGHSLLQRG